ncbi:hypothetical protein ACFL08_01695 [Patescibacteria group bacterium]
MCEISNLTLRIFCSACSKIIGCQYFKSESVTYCWSCDNVECGLKRVGKMTRQKFVRGVLHSCNGPLKKTRPCTW